MNKKGFIGETALIVIGAVVFGIITVKTVNINLKTTEGKVENSKITLTELTKSNGKTIWCKIRGKSNCN